MRSREKCATDLTALLMRSLVLRLAANCKQMFQLPGNFSRKCRKVLKLTKVRFMRLEGILLLKNFCLKIDCNFLF